MPASQFDFLIIGQGLAGSILAFELIRRGQSTMVIDNNHVGSASQVAAGIINPITGHRLNLTDNFIDYLAAATKFYNELEETLGVNVISHIGQLRLIKNPGQANYLAKRLQQSDYAQFIEASSATTPFQNPLSGVAKIKQTSIVDTKLLLREVKAWLSNQHAYLNTEVDYTKLTFTDKSISYGQITADNIVFCEGYQAINNPWLMNLPFKLAKGEILTLEKVHDDWPMLSWGNWLAPQKTNTSKLGSNYTWHDTELTTVTGVKEKLLDSLERHTGLKATVLNHEVGIRPTTTDRHAFVGPIKKLERAYCFNGFGSKGCLTIPSHAHTLCNHLIDDVAIPEELSKWL